MIFFRLGLGVRWGWPHNGGMSSRFFGWGYLAVGANPKSHFWLVFWNLGYYPSL